MKTPFKTRLIVSALLSFTVTAAFSMATGDADINFSTDKEPAKKNNEKVSSRGDALEVTNEANNETQASPNDEEKERTINWGDCTKADFDRE